MIRRFLIVTVALIALLTMIGVNPAAAATKYASNTTVYADGSDRQLVKISIDAKEGDAFFVRARLHAENASHRILVALRVNCLGEADDVRTTQNMAAGQARAVLNARYIFKAPSDGTFNCRLKVHARIPGYGSIPTAKYRVNGSGTLLTVVRQPDWTQHGYQASQVLIKSGKARDVATMSFTAPAGLNSFGAIADVEFTNCYNDGGLCDTTPGNTRNSVIGSRLLVMQNATSGGYCRITRWPASGLDTMKITWAVHHKKNYHRLWSVPVSGASGCTRNFRIKVHAKVLSGNDALVEPKPWTNVLTKTG